MRPNELLKVRNEKVAKLLEGVFAGGDSRALFDALVRLSGMPGPNPNLDLARAVGAEIAAAGGGGLALTDELLAARHPYLVRVGLQALAARASDRKDPSGAMKKLHDAADEIDKAARDAVIAALSEVITARGDEVVPKLAAFTDGFLHAYVALEALTARKALDAVKDGVEVTARLDEAFALADTSSRADERAQGVRLLREGLPAHVARLAARFPEARAWLEERLVVERPESRDVIGAALVALRRAGLPEAEAERLVADFEKHSPVRRDAARVVEGTRKRGRATSKPRTRYH
ncbi:MAG: hypothetical protein U0414_28695 [Polyangiaceae bacterium]